MRSPFWRVRLQSAMRAQVTTRRSVNDEKERLNSGRVRRHPCVQRTLSVAEKEELTNGCRALADVIVSFLVDKRRQGKSPAFEQLSSKTSVRAMAAV